MAERCKSHTSLIKAYFSSRVVLKMKRLSKTMEMLHYYNNFSREMNLFLDLHHIMIQRDFEFYSPSYWKRIKHTRCETTNPVARLSKPNHFTPTSSKMVDTRYILLWVVYRGDCLLYEVATGYTAGLSQINNDNHTYTHYIYIYILIGISLYI